MGKLSCCRDMAKAGMVGAVSVIWEKRGTVDVVDVDREAGGRGEWGTCRWTSSCLPERGA